MARFPKAYTDLLGRHTIVRADQTPISDLSKAEGPAIEVEKDSSFLQRMDLGWLPFAAKTYCISPHIESYVVIPSPICPAILPNRNGIAFPLQELIRYQPPPIARQVYKAWAGCPVHLEHDNEDHTKAYGVVLDAMMTKILGYGNNQYWKVMGLSAVDKDKYPEIAQELLDGTIQTFSMGALADTFSCSVCGAEVHGKKEKYRNCPHVTHSGDVNFSLVNYQGQRRLAFLNAHGLSPIEYSIVRDPAWVVASSDQILFNGN